WERSTRTSPLHARLLEGVEPALELVVGRSQRRKEAEDVAVEAAGQDQQAVLARLRDRRFRRVARLLGELDRQHRAKAPDVADRRLLHGDLLEPAADQPADGLGAAPEAVLGDRVE